MSHLSILPTAFTDLDRLASVLLAEGYSVERQATLSGFGSEQQLVDLKATSPSGIHFAWRWCQAESRLELLADVERQGAALTYRSRLQRIVRLYALAEALATVASNPALQGAFAS